MSTPQDNSGQGSSGQGQRGGRPNRQGPGKTGGTQKPRTQKPGTQKPGSEKPGAKQGGERRASGQRVSVDPVRAVVRDVLRAVRERDAYANLVLPKMLRDRRLEGRDAALATELTYGACRTRGLLDAVIADCAGRPLEEIDPLLLDSLRLGVYQLLRTRVAAHAALSTTVDLVTDEQGKGAAGFVNAVLRRASEREEAEWITRLAPPADQDALGHLAFRHNHPVWIARAFTDALGADAGELADALAADNVSPQVHLVARPGVITAEELALVTGGEEGKYSPYAVYLEGGDPGKLEPVRDGLAGVQDEGSQIVARAVAEAELVGDDGGRWLDLCAGPGGKAALLGAIAAIDGATLDAVEPQEHRAELVRKAVRELPVTVHVVDGRETGLEAGYDRVLVDAPCTGLGALRRRPEARWRRQPSDVNELVTLQRQLLAAAVELTREGGVIVYSTCSPHIAETVGIVADAVRRFGLTQLDSRDLVPAMPQLGDGPHVQLWPHRHGTDAMFIAALRK
ncbi:RsmB/NOP family class I SAM-dependent RNA methyltransferase [Tomitella biformata]|uniref:RsmB/NOP family class I SAM-dependent RNA methyltransferase n=1 Tax=Tomitella biformata TaxID=630403 RepID=UPI0004679BE0|nr:transcription antitermination factor NusB [Tomitella biformata]